MMQVLFQRELILSLKVQSMGKILQVVAPITASSILNVGQLVAIYHRD